jgi:hypothetical protein
MGKSHIIRKIETKIEKEYHSCGVVHLDLKYSGKDPIPNFEKIVQKLSKYGFSFPCFYFAIILYFSENGYFTRIPDFTKRLQEYPEQYGVGNKIGRVVFEKTFGVPVEIISEICSIIENAAKIQTPYIRDFLTGYNPVHKDEKLDYLGYALYLDIINSELHNKSDLHNKWKIVFLIDTYELFHEAKFPLLSASEKWLYKFVLSFVSDRDKKINIDPIFIISGRESIRWEKYGEISETLIEKLPEIEELEKEDCYEYLTECNVPNGYHESIYHQCQGYPFPLQMLTFLYFQLEEKGEILPNEIVLTPGNYIEIYEMVIRHLPTEIVRLLESLAFCGWFDRKILFKIAMNLHNLNWSEQSFNDITDYTFCKSIDNDKYSLQQSFKKILVTNYSLCFSSESIKFKHKQLYKFFASYYEKEKANIDNFTKILILREMCNHGILAQGNQQKTIMHLKDLCENYQDYSFTSEFILDSLENNFLLFNSLMEIIQKYIKYFTLSAFVRFIELLGEKKIDAGTLENLKTQYFTDNYYLEKRRRFQTLRSLRADMEKLKNIISLNYFLTNITNEDYLRMISISSLSQVLHFMIHLRRMIGMRGDPVPQEIRFIRVFFQKNIHFYKIEDQNEFINDIKRLIYFFKDLDPKISENFYEKLNNELSADEKNQFLYFGIPL